MLLSCCCGVDTEYRNITQKSKLETRNSKLETRNSHYIRHSLFYSIVGFVKIGIT